MSLVLVNIGLVPNDSTGDVLRDAFNLINNALTTLDNEDNTLQNNINNLILDKVKATSGGTAGYLDAVIDLGSFVENTGDSEQIVIEGKQATSTEIKNRSTNQVIIAPYQLPQVSAKDQQLPSLDSYKRSGGIKVKRVGLTNQELFQIEFDSDILSEITSANVTPLLTYVVISHDSEPRKIGLSEFRDLLNSIVYEVLCNVPFFYHIQSLAGQSYPAYSGVLKSNIRVKDSDGNDVTTTTTDFSAENLNNVSNILFSTSLNGYIVMSGDIPAGIYDSDGSELWGCDIVYTDSNGFEGRLRVGAYNPISGTGVGQISSGGAGGVDIAIQEVSAWPSTSDDVDSNCLLINTTTGEMRHYQYDSVNDQYCYIPYTNGSGSCLAAKT